MRKALGPCGSWHETRAAKCGTMASSARQFGLVLSLARCGACLGLGPVRVLGYGQLGLALSSARQVLVQPWLLVLGLGIVVTSARHCVRSGLSFIFRQA